MFQAPFRWKKVENTNSFDFHPSWLKFGKGGNFQMLISKRKPKMKLENNLGTNLAVVYYIINFI